MRGTPADRPLAVLAVGTGPDRPVPPTALEGALPESSTVARVDSIRAVLDRDPDAVDCVVSAFDLGDESAADLHRTLSGREAPPPVVLAVDADDGSVPAAAVSTPFAAVVAIGAERDRGAPAGSRSDADRVTAAVTDVVPGRSGPSVASGCPRDSRSLDAWKAALFDQFFTEIPLHTFVKDDEGRHVMVSEAPVDRRVHRLGEEYLGRRDIDGVLPDPEGREPYEDDMRVIDTGESILGKEEYYPSVDRWFRTSKVPWTDEHGEVSGLVGIAQEVTARKDRERQLEITHHVVRHTLRNKLNAILGRCNRIVEGGSVAENAERIAEAVSALTDTVGNQQTILEMMIGEPEATPTNLSRVVRHRVELAEARAPEATIELRVDDEAVALATANVGCAVEQLLANAIEYADGQPQIAVALETDGAHVQLCVRDGPPSIPAFEVEVLTGGRSIDHLNHSTGLGLWIVQWAVKHAGGAVAFERTDTGGNEVALTFPVADAAGEPPDSAAES